MPVSISTEALYARLGLPDSPAVVDVRGEKDWLSQPRLVPGAQRGEPARVSEWAKRLLPTRKVVVCGRDRSDHQPSVLRALATLGHPVFLLEGGLEAWTAAGLSTVRMRAELNTPGGSRWITRERPKIDRLACPWLVRRFIDPDATFFYTPAHRVRAEAEALAAEPYDISDVRFSHRGSRCSFDAFLAEFDLRDPVLDRLADVVRAADTGELGQSREAPGLLAISLGLAANEPDDIVLLEQAMPIYDAIYAWCKKARNETHSWPQQAARP